MLAIVRSLESNTRTVYADKRFTIGPPLVKKGIVETAPNDPNANWHAYVMPEFVWEHLQARKEFFISWAKQVQVQREQATES
jgi:hypothetical protein